MPTSAPVAPQVVPQVAAPAAAQVPVAMPVSLPVQGQYMTYSPYDQFVAYSQHFSTVVLDVLMRVIAGAVILIVGFLIAWVVEWVVRWLLNTLKINDLLRNVGFGAWLEKANVELKTENFLGKLAFWLVWLLFWMQAFMYLKLTAFNQFLGSVLGYIPTAIAGGLILVAGIFLGEFLKKVVSSVLKGSEVKGASAAGVVVYWAVVIFSVAAALVELGVARELILILVQGIVFLLVLAGGLAFGLGGQDAARDIIAGIRREMKD